MTVHLKNVKTVIVINLRGIGNVAANNAMTFLQEAGAPVETTTLCDPL